MVAAIQLPLASPPATPLPLDPKLFKPGTLLEAIVLAKSTQGLTQLQIGDLLVIARLPQELPPGTTLQLAVKSGGAVPELAVVVQQSPSGGSPAVVKVPRPAPPLSSTAQSVSLPPELPVAVQQPPATPSTQPTQVLTTAASRLDPGLVASSGTQPPGQPAMPQVSPTPSSGGTAAAPVTASVASVPQMTAPAVSRSNDLVAQISTAQPSSQAQGPVPLPSVASSVVTVAPSATEFVPPQVVPPAVQGAQLVLRPAPLAPTSLAQPSALPQTPQAALTQMVPAALAQQGSPVPLLQALSAAVTAAVPLPAPVLRAAQHVLANRVPVNGLFSGEVLKAAIERSGVAMEAILRGGSPPSATDAKAGLLALRSALVSWLGDLAPVDPVRRVSPPIKGETLRATMTDPMPDLPPSAHDVGRALHGHAEAALSRMKLMQLASLPDADGGRQAGPEMRLELPLLVGSELAMAQLQIFRDGKRQRDAAKRGWTMRFAVATQATGEVGAEVGLIGKTVSVALWAAEETTASSLSAALPELNESLGALGLTSSIRIRSGPPRGAPSTPGTFVDRGS